MAFIKGTQSSENGVKHALGMYQMNHTKYVYIHTHTQTRTYIRDVTSKIYSGGRWVGMGEDRHI